MNVLTSLDDHFTLYLFLSCGNINGVHGNTDQGLPICRSYDCSTICSWNIVSMNCTRVTFMANLKKWSNSLRFMVRKHLIPRKMGGSNGKNLVSLMVHTVKLCWIAKLLSPEVTSVNGFVDVELRMTVLHTCRNILWHIDLLLFRSWDHGFLGSSTKLNTRQLLLLSGTVLTFGTILVHYPLVDTI